jgi:DNA-binding transcriptional ArsR family regulator
MAEFSLNESVTKESLADRQTEDFLISSLRPELNYICSNPIRACIIHMLVENRDLGHTIQVEEIARRLGKRHSVMIYHLERLLEWRIVRVVKTVKHGDIEKRTIWGLNLEYPNLIREVYSRMLKLFFTQKELNKLCSINKNVRK